MVVEGFSLKFIFEPIFSPIENIASGFLRMFELIVELVKLITKLLSIVGLIFNPVKLLNDIVTGAFLGIQVLFDAIFQSLNIRNLFGTKRQNNGILGVSRTASNAKCVNPSLFRLIIMVLCPPLAVFMHRGISAIINIIITALLTIYGYYFPGLIYAMMIVLC